MRELGIPELNSDQIEKLCLTVDKTARDYILMKIPQKRIKELNIIVETEGTKPIKFTVDINVSLSPLMKNFDVQHLVDNALKEAFLSAENYLVELTWRSKE